MRRLIPDHSPGSLLIVFIMVFLTYWLMVESVKIRSWFLKKWGPNNGVTAWFVWNKLHGTILFGVVFSLFAFWVYPDVPASAYALALPKDLFSWMIGIVLTVLLGIASWQKNRASNNKKKSFGRYPELAASNWSLTILIIDICMWMAYLFSYELMFRGILLGMLSHSVGFWTAVGINVALYAAVHIPKGAQEAIGALLLGYVLCILTEASGSLFTAFASHCALAITNDISAFYYRDDMYWKSGRVSR